MAADEWYYSQNGHAVGPMRAKELKQLAANGRIAPTDFVCRAGDEKWIPAHKVRGLFPAPQAAPAPKPADERIASRHEARAEAHVVPDPERCVQCGICSHNCPMEIDVRAHAHRGIPIHDSHCLTCSECVKRCPRGVLSFERIPLFTL
jgi:NAD-dependent dihydropyrimidine dehydrogenase PreA subunit